MSEFGFLGFGLPDEVNPVEAAQQKAAAVQKINEELETRGIVAFALKAESIPEVEQRLLMREVDNQINEIVATYLPGDDDAKQRVVSNIFKKFEASKKADLTEETIEEKTASDDDKMPMKDGKPASLSDDEEDEDSEDEDEDEEDSEDDEDESEEDEDSEDDDDENDSSNEKEASLTHLARDSRACELGNHSDCDNCSCNCHQIESSGACEAGDHAGCRVNNYAESDKERCGCGCHS